MKTHTIDALTLERPWLETLAHRLAHTAGEADDIVQETYLAALQSPPPANRPLRAWLSRVATNANRMRYRTRTRRSRREQWVATPMSTDGRTLIARNEVKQVIADAIEELEEPYRSTIVLRFLEDLSIAAIAEKEGVATGTVGWRIHEGLKRLRHKLDKRSGGDCRPWLAAGVPTLQMRLPETTVAQAATTAQGITMTKAIITSIGVIAGGAVAVGIMQHSSQEDSSSLSPSSAVATSSSATPTSEQGGSSAHVPNQLNGTPKNSGVGNQAATLPSSPQNVASVEERRSYKMMSGAPGHASHSDELAELFHGCYQDLVRRKPEMANQSGRAQLDLELAPDDEIGSVVSMSDYVESLSTIDDEEFKECLRESSFAMDGTADVPAGGNAKIALRFGRSNDDDESEVSNISQCIDALKERQPSLVLEGRIEDSQFTECLIASMPVPEVEEEVASRDADQVCVSIMGKDNRYELVIDRVGGEGASCGDAEPRGEQVDRQRLIVQRSE
jgi:RNA polymerase sigma factor (sigma-70 family)